jgi:hypothetical protein
MDVGRVSRNRIEQMSFEESSVEGLSEGESSVRESFRGRIVQGESTLFDRQQHAA